MVVTSFEKSKQVVQTKIQYAHATEQMEYGNIYGSAPAPQRAVQIAAEELDEAMDYQQRGGIFRRRARRADFNFQPQQAVLSHNLLDQNNLPATYDREVVWCSRRIVRDGERIAVWDNRTGACEFIDGPARPYLFRKTIEKMRCYRASPETYLVVVHRDGRKEHVRGPVALFFNPIEHQRVTVGRCVNMNSSEAIVVYRGDENSRVSRAIIHGPSVHMPLENEWQEQFAWGRGSDPNDPPPPKFTKLKITPQQFFIDVENVRTQDNQILTMSYMVIFQLVDIERMLTQTNDPLMEFSNALCADMIKAASKIAFEGLKELTDRLNDLGSYAQLLARSVECGFTIHKVAFRGYQTTDAVQRMQENGVATRTAMAFEREQQETRESLLDLHQHREQRRAQEKHEMELATTQHAIRLKEMEAEAAVESTQRLLEMRLKAERETARVHLDYDEATLNSKLEFVRALGKSAGLQATEVLVAEAASEPHLERPTFAGVDQRGFLPPMPVTFAGPDLEALAAAATPAGAALATPAGAPLPPMMMMMPGVAADNPARRRMGALNR